MKQSDEAVIILPFNESVKIKASRHASVTSDAGALLMRGVLDKTGLVHDLGERLVDRRDPRRTTHSLKDLLQQQLLLLAQGWDVQLDADRLRTDPGLCMAANSQRGTTVLDPEEVLASQPTMSRLLGLLSEPDNLAQLRESVANLGVEHMLTRQDGEPIEDVVIDIDAVPLDAHGHQLGSAYNGHYKRTIFLPLIATCGETGDVLGAELRPGNQREVTDCEDFIARVARAVRPHCSGKVIARMDAGFNSGAVCEALEQDNTDYVMRLRKNSVLEKKAHDFAEKEDLKETEYGELEYGAKSWGCTRRVVVVAEPRPQSLFQYHFYYLVTSLPKETYPAARLVAMYQRRGKAEMHQGEMKSACSMSLSSSPRAKSHYRNQPIECQVVADDDNPMVRAQNAAKLQVYMLVYQLLHIGRCILHSTPGTPLDADTVESPKLLAAEDVNIVTTPPASAAVESPELLAAEDAGTAIISPGVPVDLDPMESSGLFAAEGVNILTTPPASEAVAAPAAPDAQSCAGHHYEPHMHIRIFRLKVLKVGAQFARHARNIIIYAAASALEIWQRFWKHCKQLHWHSIALRC